MDNTRFGPFFPVLCLLRAFYSPLFFFCSPSPSFLPQQNNYFLRVAGKYEGMQVWTDGMRITQIISNIVSNAVKFTHKGIAIIFFIIYLFICPPSNYFSFFADTGYVKISVSIEEDLETEHEAATQCNQDEEVMG
jgi:hypothetical protein